VPKSVWRAIRVEYERLQPYWELMSRIDPQFDQIMDETERRIADDEKIEAIQQDIKER